jgi:hypothetical protein
VSAVIAAFFYLRVVVLMYLPGQVAAPALAGVEASRAGPAPTPAEVASAPAAGLGPARPAPSAGPTPAAEPAASEHGLAWLFPTVFGPLSGTGTLDEGPGLDPSGNGAGAAARAAEVTTAEPTPRVPVVATVVIVVCVLFTIGFGLVPSPLVHFAHNSTLLL